MLVGRTVLDGVLLFVGQLFMLFDKLVPNPFATLSREVLTEYLLKAGTHTLRQLLRQKTYFTGRLRSFSNLSGSETIIYHRPGCKSPKSTKST